MKLKQKKLNMNLKEILKDEHKGDTPIYLVAMRERQKFRVPRDRWISLESDAVSVLRDQLGEENVKVEDN